MQSRADRDDWSGDGATVTIRILPAWWATWWFRSAALLALAAAIWAIYRMRLRYVASRLDLRFEERLAERVRIAGDLHDTLLQYLLSASMHLDVAADSLPDTSPVKGKLERVLGLMNRAAQDGRKAVQGLRSRDSLRLEAGLPANQTGV